MLDTAIKDIEMKTLLEVYEQYRDNAKAQGDGYAFLYWASRCTEVLSIMENQGMNIENNP